MNQIIVGMGEALWDVLPEGKKIGGAPANFAYHVSQFGFDSRVVSAIGDDKLGNEILENFDGKNLKYQIEKVPYPTGTVQVELDPNGVPMYDIKEGVAWDNIPFTPALEELAKNTRSVCFGSLAQRSVVSRETINRFLDVMPEGEGQCKIFDVNLRQGFYTKEILCNSMKKCNILKINDEELVTVSRMFGYPGIDLQDKCWILLAKYNLKMLILTCGVNGSYVFTPGEISFVETPKVEVADTVGAGDSFTATFDLAQRKGRIERQGNQNPLVHVYRYVTEGTFDAYLWQTVENKQKFISQIMTSKSPVRSCDDVDETALSFAEIKALCAGDPRIKERMDLDVEVSRLKLMKADHQSKQYRLEDQLLKYFPEEIEKHKGFIKGFESDLEVLAAHPHPEDGFAGMEIRGDLLTDKENAGAALLDACKEVKTSDPVQIGSYRGYAISVEFSAWKQEYTLLLKGQMTHRATLGTDPRGNLTRIDNALAQMPQRLEAAKAQLDNLYQQQAAAKEEVGKPFLYEEELRSKNARLVELDTLLNIDGKGQAHTESVVAKSTRTSVLDNLKRPVQPRSTDKKPKQHEEVR